MESTVEYTQKPYRIMSSALVGRYLEATRPINAGEIIICEAPVVFGPPLSNGFVCLGCYQRVPLCDVKYRCPGCFVPMCNSQCVGWHAALGHSKCECDILRKSGIAKSLMSLDENYVKLFNKIVFAMRCLYLKNFDCDKWAQLIALESHNDLRKNFQRLWSFNQEQVIGRIKTEWRVEEFSDEEIHTVCGIIETNCFGLGLQGSKGRGLYPTTSIMAHDCCPNVRTAIHPTTLTMTVRALRDIELGESITTTYVDCILGTLQRREKLKKGKYFWCACRRCADPTELGTYCSALRCLKCTNGIILPINPLSQDSLWQCFQCSINLDASMISVTIERLFEELDSLENRSIENLEGYLQRSSHILGEAHYLVILAKYYLCQMYNLSHHFSEDVLRRREQYCRDVLRAFDVLKPGLSLVRAISMFNLHIPLVSLAKLEFERKDISVIEYRKRLQEAVRLLAESEFILRLDPGDAREQEISKLARMALLAIRQLMFKLI